MTGRDQYLSDFSRAEPRLAETGADWMHVIRKQALDHFAAAGFPKTREENWKYTNLGLMAQIPFRSAPLNANGARTQAVSVVLNTESEGTRLVFLDGRYWPELSSTGQLPDGTVISSLKSAFDLQGDLLKEHLTQHASVAGNPLTALNTAFLDDGAFVCLPHGVGVEGAIHLVFLSSGGKEATVSHPRSLIIAGRGSELAIVEHYLSLGGGEYFANAVTEISLGDGAVVDHYKLQQESEKAFHIATIAVKQSRGSSFSSCSISLGGQLVRNNITAVMAEDGGSCSMSGLYVVRNAQHVDNHTLIDHAAPHCTSQELYNGVLGGKATGVFNGRVVVRPNAQKTSAEQRNRNLLLSEGALVNSKPQLEIFADDVKCSHAATMGRLDEDAIFYLRSRGLSRDIAQQLLIGAFADEIVSKIKIDSVRQRLRQNLLTRLTSSNWAEEIR